MSHIDAEVALLCQQRSGLGAPIVNVRIFILYPAIKPSHILTVVNYGVIPVS